MTNKVLFTASTFLHIVNFHLPYLEWFKGRGWEVHVACGGKQMPIPHADRVILLPLQKRMGSVENFRAAKQLRRLIREEKYDLISVHSSLAAFFTRLAVKGMKDRSMVVNTVHGYLFDEDTPAIKRWILLAAERITEPETDLLMTMNEWDYKLAQREKLGKRIINIPGMGVDFAKLDCCEADAGKELRCKLGISEDAFVLIYPAEFSRRKSQEVLIEAMTELPERVILVLPGEGNLLEDCKALANTRNLHNRVIFPGQVSDMAPWYAMADASVSASRSEGLPFNLIEAMHCGLPIVASKVKGHTDLIQNEVTGLLYPYGDSTACAAAIRSLMTSTSLRHYLSQNAKSAATRYGVEQVFPILISIFENLVSELRKRV